MTAEGLVSEVLHGFTPGGLPRYVLRLPYERPPLSLNDRGQTRKARMAKSRKVAMIRRDVTLLGRSLELEPWPHLEVVLHWAPKENRRRDPDNAVATMKPAIDALTAAGAARGWACLSLVPDDDPEHVTWHPPVLHPPDEHGPRLWLTITAHPRRPDARS